MHFQDGGEAMKRAIIDGARSRRAETPWRVWVMAFLGLFAMAPLIAVTFPNLSTASAASPPVARDDVARTNFNTAVNVAVVGNDFDPDGDGFSVVSASTPAHGTVQVFSNSVTYRPDTGFSGVDSTTYTIQDNTGSTAAAVLTVWVDTGVEDSNLLIANRDYMYVYQGQSVAVTTAELLSNDVDPTHPAPTSAWSTPTTSSTT
jgi:Bacterial Ig domain